MGNELLAAKVVVLEEAPRIRNIQGVATAVTAAVGITERGPVGTSTLSTSFEEWVKIFGSFISDSDLTIAVQGFYDNGGSQLFTVRTVHYTDITSPASKTSLAATINLATGATAPTAGTVLGANAAPFDLEPGDTMSIDIDAGGTVVATFTATSAVRTSGNAETYDLLDGLTLTVRIDGGGVQTITFDTAEFVDITNATALEVAAVINAEMTGGSADGSSGSVVITSDSRGTGSSVEVTGGTANTGGANRLAFATALIAGTGNVVDIDAVSAAEVETVLEAAVANLDVTIEFGAIRLTATGNPPGVTSIVQVLAVSTADDELGFDNATHSGSSGASVDTLQVDGRSDGTYANDIRLLVAAATSGEADRFNLDIEDNGVVVERFPNLSMLDSDDSYIETIVNDPDTGSDLVQFIDLDAGGAGASALIQRPANGVFGPMTGGNDGLVGLDDNDFIGSAAGGTGIRAFDQTLGIRILTIPGRATSAVHNAMITYSEITRSMEMFAILDIPAGLTAVGAVTYVVTTASLKNLSEFGAIYWPRIKVLNPNKTIFGNTDEIVVPPSLHLAGMYARTDGSQPSGVFIPPAGEETGKLFGVTGLETDEVLDEAKRDLVFPELINPIVKFPGAPFHADGARTLKSNGNFPTIGERRGVIFVEQSVKDFLRVFKHKNNTEPLRASIDRSITAFLFIQTGNNAFQSTDPAKAFFVDVSAALNPPSVIFARQLVIRVGLATNKPSEFIILRVSQDTRALEEELAALAA